MGRASVVYGLNPYLLCLSNPVSLFDGLGCSPGFHTIETCNELFFEPPRLTGWQRFWRSEAGRALAVGLLTFGLVLSVLCPKFGLVFGLSLGLAGVSLVAGGVSAGRRSRDRGGECWEGVVDYVSGAWAQSVSLSVTVSAVSFGLAKGIGAVAVRKAGGKKQLASAKQSFHVMEFDQRAIEVASAQVKHKGVMKDPTFSTFKRKLFAEQQRLHGTFDANTVLGSKSPFINDKKVILHHPLGKTGGGLFNVVGVTQEQHILIHAVTGYKNARWDAVIYILGQGVF